MCDHKIIICVRHGERTDHVGLTPVLHKFDPELTYRGQKQALEAGKLIKDELLKLQLNPNKKILVLSSPFTRTLQTSIGIIRALQNKDYPSKSNQKVLNEENEDGIKNNLNIESKIIVDNNLCEYIDDQYLGQIPQDFLSIIHGHEFFSSEMKNINLCIINSFDLLPKKREKYEECFDRINHYAQQIVEYLLNQEDCAVVILVTHGTPIDNLNKSLGYPGPFGFAYIDYCSTYYYLIDREKGYPKFYKKTTPRCIENGQL